MTALITTDALARKLGEPGFFILDASWYMPAEKRDARAEYEAAHIPAAAFFDIDAISDRASPYPHMLPDAKSFAAAAGALGLSNGSEVVVYDGNGLFSAARVWWMLRVFGHDNVKVLDGGLPKWKAERRTLENGAPQVKPAVFTARSRPELVRDIQQVRENITHRREQMLDARSPGRFTGTEAEPRPGLMSGHIPGSMNLHYRECLKPPYNCLKSPDELRTLLSSKIIDWKKPAAATCGSGVTACILALALYELGNTQVAVYDGAWAEWGSQKQAS